MKKSLRILLFLLFALNVNGQTDSVNSGMNESGDAPRIFMGISSGLNNPAGMAGIFGEIFPGNHLSLAGSVGLSPWGYKLTGGLGYYPYQPFGTYFSLGLSYLSGSDSTVLGMVVEGIDTMVNVAFNMKTTYCVNLIVGYQHKLWKKTRVHIEVGYTVPLRRNTYSVVTPDIELTDYSVQMLGLLEPGGIIISAGFSIGIY
jgi:hypothetical protein